MIRTSLTGILWGALTLIGYTYAGYPLLVGLLARLVPGTTTADAPPLPEETLPTVTLLIAAYNEEATLAQKLENSLALAYPQDQLQILVATDGSDDGTVAIAERFADRGVALSHSPLRGGKVAAINRALARAQGEIVIFSDANNLYTKNSLRALVAPFGDPRVGAVAGAKVILRGDGALGDSEGLYWRYESWIKQQESRLGNCVGVAGEILAVRRALIRPLPTGIINDDAYLAMELLRRGYQIRYAPAARSVERVSLTAADEVARRTRINAGRYQALAEARDRLPWRRPIVLWQILSHKFLRLALPLAMIAAAASNLLLVLVGGRIAPRWPRVLLAGQSLFYLAALVGNTVTLPGKLGKLLYLPTFLVNSNGAALLGLLRYLRGAQRVQWQRAQRRATTVAPE
jgi:cellulose synthase/poly-beta-1,6-N-acetylglucosamine synthase-like glycosyltransferase